LNLRGQSGVSKLKAASQMLIFLTDNKIFSIESLEQKVNAMHSKFNSFRTDMKKTERRISTLQEHIMHSDKL
jgi:peptidoglycan hydrolase CwlO-like protein